ncbi:MBL fold metallo-hydrolase [Actinomadura rubrisoli]|uniref:MBL fold metallo-hydrolase n=1 Tax=Actinomadura rubrisoli TaxID=2530368 RepID=UPI001FB6FB33|nr:MBL fold metallo-hydrolase [Actinomadura rubrisoli]
MEPEDLGGGVWSVPVPIPGNPLAYTLVYAVESPRGPVLIDAGWQHEDSWTALRDGLGAFGIDIADVHGVVVTHYHPDHAGLAGRVRETSGAWVAMHHADAEIVRLFRAMVARGEHRAFELSSLRRAGATAADLGDRGERPQVDPPAVPDRELSDGDLVDLPGRVLRVIWTPGHSPGHICLHLEDGDRVFTGDHVLPRITPHIGLYPYDLAGADPLGDFLGSLDKISGMTVDEVLPAHQHRFRGLPGRAREIIDHHERRLAEVTALLTAVPITLWDLTAALTWRHPWPDMPITARRMAAGEAAAHLRTLENRGTARRAGTTDPLRYTLR